VGRALASHLLGGGHYAQPTSLFFRKKRRVFFSEEKKQKTFISCASLKIRDLAGKRRYLTVIELLERSASGST
jgi:hypothetical protein